ncbi:actin filament organization protein app1 [Niveomyces insectorum RCEF 264]|uniref:Actin filament organization protein app1 n=1 Tax=Niveomyces insectorum RCEF 264 TaxID=1081102 RepID=A0A162MR89_9HYPO|nr:actin filament organization protein app1 [Niveomyces insectorum RCEF 264]
MSSTSDDASDRTAGSAVGSARAAASADADAASATLGATAFDAARSLLPAVASTHPGAVNAHRLQLLTREKRRFAALEAGLPDRSSLAARGLNPHPTCGVVDAVQAVVDKLGAGAVDDAALATIEARITPFLQDILPGRQVAALHGTDWRLLFSPGGRDGLSSDTLFTPPTGWGVISDIDDTIKRTQTSDPLGILQTTFVDAPTPIPGMPELYARLHARMGPAAPFFYLSASPYNLYPFLHAFRRAHYPTGALLLRDATPMSVAGLLATLTLGTQAYKVDRMRRLHKQLPGKTFVCIGDSTQSDPEAYGEIYRTFPGWVKLILIRKVTDIAALGIEEKNEPARFEKAFEGVPASVWHVFEDPAECYALAERVLGDGDGTEAAPEA